MVSARFTPVYQGKAERLRDVCVSGDPLSRSSEENRRTKSMRVGHAERTSILEKIRASNEVIRCSRYGKIPFFGR